MQENKEIKRQPKWLVHIRQAEGCTELHSSVKKLNYSENYDAHSHEKNI